MEFVVNAHPKQQGGMFDGNSDAVSSASSTTKKVLSEPVCPSATCNRLGCSAWALLSGARRADEASRRYLHQDDQDDDCADHLLHGGPWHCKHRGPQKGRPHRLEGPDLLRGDDHYFLGTRSPHHEP